MRISDWSSDVCSSDLGRRFQCDRCRHLRHRLSKRSRKPLAGGLTHQSEGPPARFPHVTQRETLMPKALSQNLRSEERRVGKECGRKCRSRWSRYHSQKKKKQSKHNKKNNGQCK